jgi:hypothetical protein
MIGNVHYLDPRPPRIAQFLRVGSTGHRQLEKLLDAGKLPPTRFVVDAASYGQQIDLIKALQEVGAEIVLDTNAAELSTIGRYQGAFKAAPWAQPDRPLQREDFVAGTNRSVIEPSARFAVARDVKAVLALTHLITEARSPWLTIDADACTALRVALDREGGGHIEIDYTLITSYALLRDPIARAQFVNSMRNLPFSNLWLRISGHGADATPTGIRRYIAASLDFHQLGKPIIADHLGGFAALAFVAFGAGSGFAHGAGGKERFDASNWNKPNTSSSGNGEKRVYIPGLDRQIGVKSARWLFENARSARSILGCSDPTCCEDIETMLKNPEAHQLRQREMQVRDLSDTPLSQRPSRFLDEHLTKAERVAKRAAKIKKGDKDMKRVFEKARDRLDRMQDVLGNLHQTLGDAPHPPECPMRGSAQPQSGYARRRP